MGLAPGMFRLAQATEYEAPESLTVSPTQRFRNTRNPRSMKSLDCADCRREDGYGLITCGQA